MNKLELRQLNEQIESLREKMHQASMPGQGGLSRGETYRLSRQLDRLILEAMKRRSVHDSAPEKELSRS